VSRILDSLGTAAPATPRDLADPRWKGTIASSYPNDDDAVLYLYKLYAEAYGWDWGRAERTLLSGHLARLARDTDPAR
jgi:ABC-type Fe3+ transport system substrate-binding protein